MTILFVRCAWVLAGVASQQYHALRSNTRIAGAGPKRLTESPRSVTLSPTSPQRVVSKPFNCRATTL